MTIMLLCLAVIIVALVWRASRVPIRHRWPRQARVMCEGFCRRGRSQPPPLILVRLRAMDALAFEELLLESFECRRDSLLSNRRCAYDGGVDRQLMIDGRVRLLPAKRYAGLIQPERVRAFTALYTARGLPGLFIHVGHSGGTSRDVMGWHAPIEIVSRNRLLALITSNPLSTGGREL